MIRKYIFLFVLFVILLIDVFVHADTLGQPICKVNKTSAAPNEQIIFTPFFPSKTEKFIYKYVGEASTTSTGPIAAAFILPGKYTIALRATDPNGDTYGALCPEVTIAFNATNTFSNTGAFYPYPFTSSTTKAQILSEVEPVSLGCFNLVQSLSFGYSDDVKIPKDGVIYKLQEYLKKAGYLKSNPTGYFGPLTKSAVKAFQLDNDVEPTGFVGPLTRGVIKTLSCGQ